MKKSFIISGPGHTNFFVCSLCVCFNLLKSVGQDD